MTPWMVAERSSGGWTKAPSPGWDISAHHGVWGQNQGSHFHMMPSKLAKPGMPGALGKGVSTDSVCLCQRTLFRDCPKRMRGHELWEENRFILGSEASGIARSSRIQQETSKLLPKKDIFALVFVTKGRQETAGWRKEWQQHPGDRCHPGFRGPGGRGGGEGEDAVVTFLGEAAIRIRARVWWLLCQEVLSYLGSPEREAKA